MPSRDGYRYIDQRGHEQLLQTAIRVQHGDDPLSSRPVQHSTHTVKKIVEVPYEDTVRVPVKKKVANVAYETKVMKGKELVPVKKYREVEETVIEVQEKEVRGVREVWVKKEVPYTEIVKTPVKVTKVRKVPYTDYVEKEVEVTVDVPRHKLDVQRGYRDDRVLKTKLVEVEEDITVEHRPVVRSRGTPRVRDLSEVQHYGVSQRGRSVMPDRPKTADYGDGAVYSAREYSSNHPRHQEWTVVLTKAPTKALGVHVDSADGTTLEIKRVGAGLIEDWNRAQPDREVRVGDSIVAVNGHSKDASHLRRLLNEPGQLRLTLRGSRRAAGQDPRPRSAVVYRRR